MGRYYNNAQIIRAFARKILDKFEGEFSGETVELQTKDFYIEVRWDNEERETDYVKYVSPDTKFWLHEYTIEICDENFIKRRGYEGRTIELDGYEGKVRIETSDNGHEITDSEKITEIARVATEYILSYIPRFKEIIDTVSEKVNNSLD